MTEDFQVRKIGWTLPVSCCVMTDATGINHCQHPPPKPLTRRQRVRYAWLSWWWRNRPTLHRGPCEVDE
jgi:hypothetical protein